MLNVSAVGAGNMLLGGKDMLESIIILFIVVIALVIGANLLLSNRNRKD